MRRVLTDDSHRISTSNRVVSKSLDHTTSKAHLLRTPLVDLSKRMLGLLSTFPGKVNHYTAFSSFACIYLNHFVLPIAGRRLEFRAFWRCSRCWVCAIALTASLCSILRLCGACTSSPTLLARFYAVPFLFPGLEYCFLASMLSQVLF